MRVIQSVLIAACIIICSTVPEVFGSVPGSGCEDRIEINENFSKADGIREALHGLVNAGVPGVAVAVLSEEGWWTASAGYSRIEDQSSMTTCHLHYLQSISKTYMATAILLLYEQGRISLDDTVSAYLPREYSRKISGSDEITIRMLLNHTSGIPEYNDAPAYVTYLLQHPQYRFQPDEYLRYIDGKPSDFPPGSRYSYRNSNYLILALIADFITGNHARFIQETILNPLELKKTFYRNDPDYLNYPELVTPYWDRYGNSIVENVSELQRNNVASMIGDDGMVATPVDAVMFLKALMEGEILQPSTLREMTAWVQNRHGYFQYGLGLTYFTTADETGYGHSGGGIGAGSQLYYFPDRNIYLFAGINLGTVTDSPLHREASQFVEKIYEVLLR